MHRTKRSINVFFKFDRWILVLFVILFLASSTILLRRFYVENTKLVPTKGGTYIEGSVGELQPLNPWFTVTNDVNRDIVSLVFSGLLRYNPETKGIEEDMAEVKVQGEGRIYTLTLKENLYWHDHTEDNPHPVTADDVLFTYQTIQHPEFPNSLLRQNFLGVVIEKIDDRTIQFRLDEPYYFFLSNLTLGLLPQRSFQGIPVNRLDQALDFGFNPIGSGPYSFTGIVQTELSTEVTLERHNESLGDTYHLNSVIFRIFPDYPTLLSDIRSLEGVRHVPRNAEGEPIVPRQFRASHYALPQYVALFLNLERPILQDVQLRLGLQLGTNKQSLVESINEQIIVDTPLLEIDNADWRYQFDPIAAQGALFETNWHLPEKLRLQRLLEIRDSNSVGALQMNNVVLLDTGATLSITGSLEDASTGATINGLPIQKHPTESGSWIAGIPTHGGSGSLQLGYNLVRIEEGDRIVDSFYVWRSSSSSEFNRAVKEDELVELFIQSRDGDLPDDEAISVQDLFLEKGMLRRRLSTDPRDIRINNAGDRLSLTLLTSGSPPEYKQIAEAMKEQWADLGIHVGIEIPETRQVFEEKLIARDYDIVLFGQSLLDNLDSFPYWHSSGIQRITDDKKDLRIDAYNLSQYSSFKSDSLLEIIRETRDEDERLEALEELQEILKADVPAIFLYSPLYTYAHHRDVRGIELSDLSLHSDRFLTLHNWYLKEEREFLTGKSWWSFFGWILSFV